MQTKTQYKFISPEEQSRFKESINQFSGKAYDSLNIPKDGSLNGSNVWKVLWLNQTGIRTATIPEIYSAIDNGMDLRGKYEDGREVILRSNGDSCSKNDYLAQQLASDLHLTTFYNPYIVKGLKIKRKNSLELMRIIPLNLMMKERERCIQEKIGC